LNTPRKSEPWHVGPPGIEEVVDDVELVVDDVVVVVALWRLSVKMATKAKKMPKDTNARLTG